MRKLKTQMAIGQATMADLPTTDAQWEALINPMQALSPTGVPAYDLGGAGDVTDGTIGIVCAPCGNNAAHQVTLVIPAYEGLTTRTAVVGWASI